MPVTVRHATSSDLEALLGLYAQLSPDNASTDPIRAALGLRQVLTRPELSLLVAESNGAVLGTVMLVVVPNLTHNARPWIQIENMVVDKTVRRAGVGGAFMEAAVAFAKETGAYKIQLQSAEHRHEAHAFYESLGFRASSLGFRRYFG